MQRCSRLEVQACRLERSLNLDPEEGPFRGQPHRSLSNMLGPPAAGLIVYLATGFTWLYVAGFGFSWWTGSSAAWWLLPLYVVVLVVAWCWVQSWLYEAATGKEPLDECRPPNPFWRRSRKTQ
jgi:hypothetical protein